MSCNCNNYRSMSGLGAIDPRLFAQKHDPNRAQGYNESAAYQAKYGTTSTDADVIAASQSRMIANLNKVQVAERNPNLNGSDNTAMYLGVGAAAALALLLLI